MKEEPKPKATEVLAASPTPLPTPGAAIEGASGLCRHRVPLAKECDECAVDASQNLSPLPGRTVKTHELKCWPSFFEQVISGDKPFEIRVNDRDYQVGDLLSIWRWDPSTSKTDGWNTCVRVTSMVQGRSGLPPDIAVLGFNPEEARATNVKRVRLAVEVFGLEHVAVD